MNDANFRQLSLTVLCIAACAALLSLGGCIRPKC